MLLQAQVGQAAEAAQYAPAPTSSLNLIFIVAIYGLVILKIGFFLSTSLFLFFSYYFLGERRWIWMFILSFPFVALSMFLLHGLLDIYLRDPLLKMLGIIG